MVEIDQGPVLDKRTLSRSDFVKLSAFATGSLVVVDALNKASKLVTPTLALSRAFFGSALGRSAGGVPSVPEGLAPFQDRYTDAEIEQAVTAKTSVPGANAIMVDERAGNFGVPVRILPQFPDTGITQIEFRIKEQTFQSQTTPDKLRMSTRPLKNWWPADNPNLPPESVLRKTLKEVQSGINWINDFYRANGANDALILSIDEGTTNWSGAPREVDPDNVPWPTTQCSVDLGCQTASPMSLYGEFVFGPDGRALEIGGKQFIYNDFQSEYSQITEIVNTLHERVHEPHGLMGFYEKFYSSDSPSFDKGLNEALEVYTDAVSRMALRQYLGRTPSWDKLIVGFGGDPSNLNIVWFNKVAQDLSVKGENGQQRLVFFGSRGDMIGLRDLYDGYYGKGAFTKIYRALPRQ